MTLNFPFSIFNSPLSTLDPTPEFRFEHVGLWTVFLTRVETTQKTTRETTQNEFGDSSGKSSGKIIRHIQENPHVTIPELAEKLGLSTRGIEKQIAKLKSDGILHRIGPAKGGYWEVTGDDHE